MKRIKKVLTSFSLMFMTILQIPFKVFADSAEVVETGNRSVYYTLIVLGVAAVIVVVMLLMSKKTKK